MTTATADPLVDALESSAREVEDATGSAASPPDLLAAPAPGKWSARDVLCHLADTERLIFQHRLQAFLSGSAPFFPDIDHEPWLEAHGYAAQNPAAKLREFLEERRRTVDLVRGASAGQRQARGTHEVRGIVSFADVAEYCARHSRIHADQIRRALEAAAVKTRASRV